MTSNPRKMVTPNEKQLEWASMEIGVLIHFDIEVFQPSYRFLVDGKVMPPPDVSIFNPASLDTDQWIRVAKSAGAKYALLTAKHVTGFTLFPDDEYDYSVKNTPWKDGKGDVVGNFVNSCRKHGLKPGLYYSCEANAHIGIHKGSGNLPSYPSKEWDDFKELVTRHLKIIWSRYGELFEIWFDGGTLENGPDYLGLIKELQPNAICFQGPEGGGINRIRWVGNESARAPYPCWATSTSCGAFDGTEDDPHVGKGDPDGDEWMPAESDVPNRFHQWIWLPNNEYAVTPADYLVEHYIESVGHNTNLLLGMVIDDRGLVPDPDAAEFKRFGQLMRDIFDNPVGSMDCGKGTEFELDLGKPSRINHVVLVEDISEGEKVREFLVEGYNEQWVELCKGSCIGHKFIKQIDEIEVSKVKVKIKKAIGEPVLLSLKVYDFVLDIDD
ncbi:MAG: alpha-L-fucosidase [Candidatus Hodarchaeota archaeon]